METVESATSTCRELSFQNKSLEKIYMPRAPVSKSTPEISPF